MEHYIMVTAGLKKLVGASLYSLILFAMIIGCAKKADDIVVEAPSYFGRDAVEAAFSFEAQIIAPASSATPTEASIQSSVKYAMKYVLGSIHEDGSVYAGFQTKINSVETLANGEYKVSYTLNGKGVFKASATEVKFNVPIVPEKLWALSKEKCHDPKEEVDEGNFWYSWNPERSRCPLVKNQHWMPIKVKLSPMPATADTYPEYERLIVNSQMTVSVFYGSADHDNQTWNPLDHDDLGAESYKRTRDYLINTLGFVAREMSFEELTKVYSLRAKMPKPFAEELTKQTAKGLLRIRLFFLDTQYMHDESITFHYLLKHALKNESVVFYDGHSGIGRNLNLDRIDSNREFKITFNSNYQLIYFGSCLPYAYYTDLFFKRKITPEDPNGTKNMDILAYAKESHFGNVENLRILLALDTYMINNEKTSYQKIITENPKDFFGVIGDEDNSISSVEKPAEKAAEKTQASEQNATPKLEEIPKKNDLPRYHYKFHTPEEDYDNIYDL